MRLFLRVAGIWCIEIGDGNIGDKTCLSAEVMLLAVLIEIGIYVLVGAGIWGYFKRTFLKRRKIEKIRAQNEKKWEPRVKNRKKGEKG